MENTMGDFLNNVKSLDDKTLAEAFYLLFGNNFRKNWTEQDKANYMYSLFNNDIQECCSFENWTKCINFLFNCVNNKD